MLDRLRLSAPVLLALLAAPLLPLPTARGQSRGASNSDR